MRIAFRLEPTARTRSLFSPLQFPTKDTSLVSLVLAEQPIVMELPLVSPASCELRQYWVFLNPLQFYVEKVLVFACFGGRQDGMGAVIQALPEDPALRVRGPLEVVKASRMRGLTQRQDQYRRARHSSLDSLRTVGPRSGGFFQARNWQKLVKNMASERAKRVGDRLSGTTAAIQLDGTELGAPWKCDKTRWSKHPEVGAGNPTERDRVLDALWKSDDNVCDAEVARNVSAPSSAIQAEKMCYECVPITFVTSPDKVQTQPPSLRTSCAEIETTVRSDTFRNFEDSMLQGKDSIELSRSRICRRINLQLQRNAKPTEERNFLEHLWKSNKDEYMLEGHDMVSVDQESASTFETHDLSPCRGKKIRVRMWFCKQGLALILPLRFRKADDPHVARDVREIKGPPISASGEIGLFGTKRIEKGAVKRCRKVEEKKWESQGRQGTPARGKNTLQKIDIDPEQQLHTSKIVDIAAAAAVIEMHGDI
ncbi:hypothetical protein LAZ67_X003771 [Cordylochernes scorpioides]|uniref:Uncharacterized protein n=1 Tax=Cordylochernes scorpioides TaxID=51811 RepID=A0ABY6LVE5_9ARAC|nr:hypothetical protein LAZ67_X003771 [Cordylochernes scorpioides]